MSYQFEKLNVLIVEGSPSVQKLLESIFKIFGVKECLFAADSTEALNTFHQIKPDFMIIDWETRPKNGLHVIKEIRTGEKTSNPFMPIIITSGFSSEERKKTAFDAGANEFLEKPFNTNDLYHHISEIIERPKNFIKVPTFFGPDRRRTLVQKDYVGPRRRKTDPKTNPDDVKIYEVDEIQDNK